MQLEERRHAIESQKKKMESVSAQQRLTLGKAAFLNIVKKEPGRRECGGLLYIVGVAVFAVVLRDCSVVAGYDGQIPQK
uniref:Uncharacterized protein n=1 Tax=Periophthalmus magnuspinnatus TaxID=409849 RepID=A0A3B3ZLI1_9GOBI